MYVLSVVLPIKGVSPVLLARQDDTSKNLLSHVSSVQQDTHRKKQTVKYVNSVAQRAKVKAAKQEILLVRRANLASTKLHLAPAKIVHQDSTQMAKVRRAARNVQSTPSCLILENRQKQSVHLALQIVRLEHR